VSRRLIQFIIFPERLQKNIDNFHDRGGWEAYYNKKRNTVYQRKHRRYKYKLYKEGDIISQDDIYVKKNLIILKDIFKKYKSNPFKIHKQYKDIVSYHALYNWIYEDRMPMINIFKNFMEKFKEEYIK
jgi:hypothetical protein